jgi:hypothetical protein
VSIGSRLERSATPLSWSLSWASKDNWRTSDEHEWLGAYDGGGRGLLRATRHPLELFFDLVFVFALTQVTGFLADHLTWTGMLQGAALLVVLWWAWGESLRELLCVKGCPPIGAASWLRLRFIGDGACGDEAGPARPVTLR